MYRYIALILSVVILTLFNISQPSMAKDKMVQSMYDVPSDEDIIGKVPENYQQWKKFFTYVEKPDTKQIREGYISSNAQNSKANYPLPYGTEFVMEIYAAKINANGELIKDSSGKLIKDKLSKIYVMKKQPEYGFNVPLSLNTGNWEYSAYTPDGKFIKQDSTQSCRVCHHNLAGDTNDYIFRYDEYFTTGKAK